MLKILLATAIILAIWKISPIRDSNGAGGVEIGPDLLARAAAAAADPRLIAAGLKDFAGPLPPVRVVDAPHADPKHRP